MLTFIIVANITLKM